MEVSSSYMGGYPSVQRIFADQSSDRNLGGRGDGLVSSETVFQQDLLGAVCADDLQWCIRTGDVSVVFPVCRDGTSGIQNLGRPAWSLRICPAYGSKPFDLWN